MIGTGRYLHYLAGNKRSDIGGHILGEGATIADLAFIALTEAKDTVKAVIFG